MVIDWNLLNWKSFLKHNILLTLECKYLVVIPSKNKDKNC